MRYKGNVRSWSKWLELSKQGYTEVAGYFDCGGDKTITSLTGAPVKVGGSFNCWGCTGLTDLTGAPKDVGWSFNCTGCTGITLSLIHISEPTRHRP
jgi:hypothetical protein